MRRFGYLRDPLFLLAALAYALNRWLLKPWLASRFLHGQFNDLFLIPGALPPVLWIQRQAGWRTQDGPPSWPEMGFHLLIWSLICEGIGPHWLHRGTADARDLVAYAVGGVAACAWWNRPRRAAP